MDFLLYFISGILFYLFVIPVLEQIVSVIETRLEVSKYRMSVKVAEYTKQINELSGEEEPCETQAIGFEIPSQEEFYEEDE